MINSREGLIDALQEAAELEHGLMLQYLFAALSMKKRIDEGLTGEQQELTRDWEGRVLGVVREEMAHLGTVCNLLSAIGAAPRFGRPNFPQPAAQYYPFSFTLTRFADESLYRFIRFELPKGEKPPPPPKAPSAMFAMLIASVPEPLEYQYVGELYGQIRDAFNTIPEDVLFIGPRAAQDVEEWSRRMRILRVIDRATANAAITFIVQEGEGAPGRREGSHYDTFLKIRDEFAKAGSFDAARPVVANPRTRPHRDAVTPGTLLENRNAIQVTELFNSCYEIVLLMLAQLYSYGGETAGQRGALRAAARQLMTMGIRPIAEVLTEIPAMNDPSKGTAGPSFELYGYFQLSTQRENRWTILAERLTSLASDAWSLATAYPRLGFVAENVGLLNENLRRARLVEEQL